MRLPSTRSANQWETIVESKIPLVDRHQQELIKAAESGDWGTVRRLVEAGAEINAVDVDDWTPLHYAAAERDSEIVAFLLNRQADPNLGAANSPLAIAASNGDLDIVRLLVSQGATLTSMWSSEFPFTPLMWAASFGHTEVCRYLVSEGADLEHKGQDGCTPLFEAASSGHLSATKALIQMGADINLVDSRGSSIMHYCAKGALLQIIKDLLALGLNLNARNIEGETPLHWAYEAFQSSCESAGLSSHFEYPLSTIYSLIEFGADQYAEDGFEMLPCENATTDELPSDLWVAISPLAPND